MLQIGKSPTKKNTGELEPILPDWLRDVRQQARESAEENATHEISHPKVQKNEAPDLLAGLASQAREDDDEIGLLWPHLLLRQTVRDIRGSESDPMLQVNNGHRTIAPLAGRTQRSIESQEG
jgi:hypothetical protein